MSKILWHCSGYYYIQIFLKVDTFYIHRESKVRILGPSQPSFHSPLGLAFVCVIKLKTCQIQNIWILKVQLGPPTQTFFLPPIGKYVVCVECSADALSKHTCHLTPMYPPDSVLALMKKSITLLRFAEIKILILINFRQFF